MLLSFAARDRRDHLADDARGRATGNAEARQAEERALGLDHLQPDIFAVALDESGAEVADAVDQAELHAAAATPELACEQLVVGGGELAGAAGFDPVDEDLMDVELKRFDAVDVGLLLRQEGIKGRFVLAGGVNAALDAELGQRLGKAEAGKDDADRADDGGRIGNDLVAATWNFYNQPGRCSRSRRMDALVTFGSRDVRPA